LRNSGDTNSGTNSGDTILFYLLTGAMCKV
jgi:hypothetical protein